MFSVGRKSRTTMSPAEVYSAARRLRYMRALKSTRKVPRSVPLKGVQFGGKLLQSMPITGFPEMLQVRLRYNMFTSLSCGGAGQLVYQFKINSIYDPDSTSTGHQPLYRDQLYTIYKYAVVTGCRYDIQVSTTSTTGVVVFPQATTYITTDSDSSTAIERGSTKRTFIQVGHPGRLTGYVDMKSMFGLPRTEDLLTDDLYRHDQSADPSQLCYLTMYANDTEGSTARVNFVVTLDYTVVFKEVVKIATS